MIKIGLTGGIGSGKTTISSIFKLFNIPVYIADYRSKILTEESPRIKKQLSELLGDNIYIENKLDKKLLASIIFNDTAMLQQVNSIIHPVVRTDFEIWASQQDSHKLVILETAILLESKFNNFINIVINVCSPIEDRIARCMKRDNASENEIRKRIASQMSDEDRNRQADFVIVNDNYHSLIEQVVAILNKITILHDNEK